jgi:hypothetical protein
MRDMDDEAQACIWACIWASLMPASMWLYLPPLSVLEGKAFKVARAASQEETGGDITGGRE